MKPSEIALEAEEAASAENRPPNVARYYGLLAALDSLRVPESNPSAGYYVRPTDAELREVGATFPGDKAQAAAHEVECYQAGWRAAEARMLASEQARLHHGPRLCATHGGYGFTSDCVACAASARDRLDPPNPDETPLYIPTAGETVRVVEVAPFDDDSPVKVGEILLATCARKNAAHDEWLILEARGFTTWCRVEPVCQCVTKNDTIVRHDPDCKWLKWMESKRVAPVVEPPFTESVAKQVERALKAAAAEGLLIKLKTMTAERDTALADVERLTLERDEARAVIARSLHELGANHGSLVVGVQRLKGELAVVKQDRQQIRDQREVWERRESELEAKNAELEEEKRTDAWHVGWRIAVKERDECRASLATVERQRDEPKGRVFHLEGNAADMKKRYAQNRGEFLAKSEELLAENGKLDDQLSASNAELERLKGELAKCRLAPGDKVRVVGRSDIRRIQSVSSGASYRLDGGGLYGAHELTRVDAEPDQPAPPRQIRVGQTWSDVVAILWVVDAIFDSDVIRLIEPKTGRKATPRAYSLRRDFTFFSDPPTPATVATEEGRR